MSMNSMVNRGTGGRRVGGHHCRFPACSMNNIIIETMPHVRGSCIITMNFPEMHAILNLVLISLSYFEIKTTKRTNTLVKILCKIGKQITFL